MLADNRLVSLTQSDANKPSYEQPQMHTATADALLIEQKDLRSHLALVYKRKWMIIGIVLIVTTVVALYSYQLPSLYEAETTISIDQRNENFLRAGEIVINTAADPVYWRTQLKLLENPTLIRRVVLALDLQNNPSFSSQRNLRGPLQALYRLFSRERAQSVQLPQAITGKDVESLTAEERARLAPYVNTILANLVIEPVAGTNLIKIRFTHADSSVKSAVLGSSRR